ncbi:MAG: hypothetical protein OER88_03880 [Planctomycetota bacterium]|nr:hypothetical protein [Planctomycetota bacterium]
MIRAASVLLFLLAGSLFAADPLPLDPKKPSARARRTFKDALALWEKAKPIAERVKNEKTAAEVTQDEIRFAVKSIEEAVLLWERGLALAWNANANRKLAASVRAYFRLVPKLAPPAPPAGVDEKERKRFEKRVASAKRAQARKARKTLVEYGKARKYEKQFHLCDRCSGKRDLTSPLGGRKPCPKCARRGILVDTRKVIQAQWLFHSPLYRADSRNMARVNSQIQRAAFQPQAVGPFVKKFVIAGAPEKNPHWIRFHAKEDRIMRPEDKNVEKVEETYHLYRVGKIWYLYSSRYDAELVEIPAEKKEDEEEK